MSKRMKRNRKKMEECLKRMLADALKYAEYNVETDYLSLSFQATCLKPRSGFDGGGKAGMVVRQYYNQQDECGKDGIMKGYILLDAAECATEFAKSAATEGKRIIEAHGIDSAEITAMGTHEEVSAIVERHKSGTEVH